MSIVIVRTEAHPLSTTPEIREDMERTIAHFRRAVQALCGVIMTHWPELASLPTATRGGKPGRIQALEALIHPTKRNPVVRYKALSRILGKMPSYLRRAAVQQAFGAVSSFMSNWNNFLDGEIGGEERETGARSPRLGQYKGFPSLYGGNMVLYGEKLRTVQIKLLQADGQWRFSKPLAVRGRFKRVNPLASKLELSPMLLLKGEKALLSCPVTTHAPEYLTNKAFVDGQHRVCAIDVGINTAATAAIVDSSGTVIARTFLTCGRHNDRRDALAQTIAEKQALSKGTRRGESHCKALHKRTSGLSKDAARSLSSQLALFASRHNAKVFVIENLKGWRPKGPSKKMRQRFHRFQHRMLVQFLEHKAQELGMRILVVDPRGTSRWAHDGSGVVTRSPKNAQLATFKTGKQHNADLNAAYNIAARGLAILLGIPEKEYPEEEKSSAPQGNKAATGKRSGAVERMPLVLADVRAFMRTSLGASNHAKASQVRGMDCVSPDAPTTAPVGV